MESLEKPLSRKTSQRKVVYLVRRLNKNKNIDVFIICSLRSGKPIFALLARIDIFILPTSYQCILFQSVDLSPVSFNYIFVDTLARVNIGSSDRDRDKSRLYLQQRFFSLFLLFPYFNFACFPYIHPMPDKRVFWGHAHYNL